MGRQPDPNRKKYAPLQARTLKNVLAHRIESEFPRIGGPRIRQLCAEMVLEVVGDHVRPTGHVTHGQILWMAISVDDPPSYHKRYAEGKSSDQIARETYHSIEAVDRYLGQYDRVRHCRLQGMTPEETAHTLSCGLSLVNEYLDIDRELETKNA